MSRSVYGTVQSVLCILRMSGDRSIQILSKGEARSVRLYRYKAEIQTPSLIK
jgi:hypothetical protein